MNETKRNLIVQKFHHAIQHSISYVKNANHDDSNAKKKVIDHDLNTLQLLVVERENDDILQLNRKLQILNEIHRM